jgi:hypothetical protein
LAGKKGVVFSRKIRELPVVVARSGAGGYPDSEIRFLPHFAPWWSRTLSRQDRISSLSAVKSPASEDAGHAAEKFRDQLNREEIERGRGYDSRLRSQNKFF